jgi:serine/threonine protein kinase
MKKPEEFLGRTIGDYTIEKLIGSGGMANVYLALQNSLARKVALKVFSILDSLDQSCLKRFYREAQLAASIQNENVVQIYSIEKEKDIIFIVMEYLQGPSLAELSKEIGSLNEKQTWLYALDVCRGLQAAYEKGVIHRDIKPANLILDENESVKVTDFGLSRRFTEDSELTKTGMILGTPQFISPEQVCGEPADLRSDIYSLGASLYRLLTGSALFSGKTSVEVMIKHKITPPFLPQFYQSQLSESATAILGKMLHKDSKLRYQNYEPLIKDIYHLLSQEPLEFALPPECFKVYNVILEQGFSVNLRDKNIKPKEFKISTKLLSETNLEDFQTIQRLSQELQKWSSELTSFFYEELSKERKSCPLEKKYIQDFFSDLFSSAEKENFWESQQKKSFFLICRQISNNSLLTISLSIQRLFFEKCSKSFIKEGLKVSQAFNKIFNTFIRLTTTFFSDIVSYGLTEEDPTPLFSSRIGFSLEEVKEFSCSFPFIKFKDSEKCEGCPLLLH